MQRYNIVTGFVFLPHIALTSLGKVAVASYTTRPIEFFCYRKFQDIVKRLTHCRGIHIAYSCLYFSYKNGEY